MFFLMIMASLYPMNEVVMLSDMMVVLSTILSFEQERVSEFFASFGRRRTDRTTVYRSA